MILDRNENKDVVVLLGAGAMGTAITIIARRKQVFSPPNDTFGGK